MAERSTELVIKYTADIEEAKRRFNELVAEARKGIDVPIRVAGQSGAIPAGQVATFGNVSGTPLPGVTQAAERLHQVVMNRTPIANVVTNAAGQSLDAQHLARMQAGAIQMQNGLPGVTPGGLASAVTAMPIAGTPMASAISTPANTARTSQLVTGRARSDDGTATGGECGISTTGPRCRLQQRRQHGPHAQRHGYGNGLAVSCGCDRC